MSPVEAHKPEPSAATVRLVKLVIVPLVLVTQAALFLAIIMLVQNGRAGLGSYGSQSLQNTWPTAAALAVLIIGPVVLPALAARPYAMITVLVVWLASAIIYVSIDASTGSLRSVLATLIWTAAALFPAFTVRTVLSLRSPLSAAAQMAVTLLAGVVLWWLTAPMARAVACAFDGQIPLLTACGA